MKNWERKYRRLKKRHRKLLALFKEVLQMNVGYVRGLNEKLAEAEVLLATKKKKES